MIGALVAKAVGGDYENRGYEAGAVQYDVDGCDAWGR